MAAFSDYLEVSILNHFFRNSAVSGPAAIYLAVYTTATNDAGGGTEVSGGSYARQAMTFSAPDPTGGFIVTSADVEFSNLPAVTVTNAAIWTALSGGNLLCHGAVDTPIVLTLGSNLLFSAGDITVTIA